jgi:hypothetical protein
MVTLGLVLMIGLKHLLLEKLLLVLVLLDLDPSCLLLLALFR